MDETKRRLALAKILITKGANVNAIDSQGCSPLAVAVRDKYAAMVRFLISHGADVTFGKNGYSALDEAVSSGQLEMVQMLLENKACIDVSAEFGSEILSSAAWAENAEIVRLLLQHGVNAHVGSSRELRHPLHIAVKNGRAEFAALLIEHGADVNALDYFKQTALHQAAYEGRQAIVRLLLANGAKVDVLDCKDETALDMAENARESSIAELLRKHGAKTGQDIKAIRPGSSRAGFGR